MKPLKSINMIGIKINQIVKTYSWNNVEFHHPTLVEIWLFGRKDKYIKGRWKGLKSVTMVGIKTSQMVKSYSVKLNEKPIMIYTMVGIKASQNPYILK